jgi:general stress protein YciG
MAEKRGGEKKGGVRSCQIREEKKEAGKKGGHEIC